MPKKGWELQDSMGNEMNKHELLNYAMQLAEKHAELKATIVGMLDDYEKKMAEKLTELKPIINGMINEMNNIEYEYNKIVEKIKKN